MVSVCFGGLGSKDSRLTTITPSLIVVAQLPTLNPLHADFLLSVSHCFCPQDNEIRAGICGSEVLKCLIQGGFRVESFQCYNVSRLMICS